MLDVKYDLSDEGNPQSNGMLGSQMSSESFVRAGLTRRQRELLTWPHEDLHSDVWLNAVGEGHAPGVGR